MKTLVLVEIAVKVRGHLYRPVFFRETSTLLIFFRKKKLLYISFICT